MMSMWQLQTPVILMIFNRPETTARVFAEIARARPPKLLVVADGPRPNIPGDAEKCAAARAITERVDWPCEVITNYAETNIGCGRRVSSGLDWAFSVVEEAIILEDDCLPNPTFFRYCEELLERYRTDTRIMAITGSNFQLQWQRTDYSYYFSIYPHVWGWATWRRSWALYDHTMDHWPAIRDGGWLHDVLGDPQDLRPRAELFQKTYDRQIDTWDYQWTFSCWAQGGLAIAPSVNLISNIGFDLEATHTTSNSSHNSNTITLPMQFPLRHPPFVVRDRQADSYYTHSLRPEKLTIVQRAILKAEKTPRRILKRILQILTSHPIKSTGGTNQ